MKSASTQTFDRFVGSVITITGCLALVTIHRWLINTLRKAKGSRLASKPSTSSTGSSRSAQPPPPTSSTEPDELHRLRYSKANTTLHLGSCHCQRVRFRIRAPRNLQAVDTSSKVRFPRLTIPCDWFELLTEESVVSMYAVNTENFLGVHTFCSYCGVHLLYSPSLEPKEIHINTDCIDRTSIESIAYTYMATPETMCCPVTFDPARPYNKRGSGSHVAPNMDSLQHMQHLIDINLIKKSAANHHPQNSYLRPHAQYARSPFKSPSTGYSTYRSPSTPAGTGTTGSTASPSSTLSYSSPYSAPSSSGSGQNSNNLPWAGTHLVSDARHHTSVHSNHSSNSSNNNTGSNNYTDSNTAAEDEANLWSSFSLSAFSPMRLPLGGGLLSRGTNTNHAVVDHLDPGSVTFDEDSDNAYAFASEQNEDVLFETLARTSSSGSGGRLSPTVTGDPSSYYYDEDRASTSLFGPSYSPVKKPHTGSSRHIGQLLSSPDGHASSVSRSLALEDQRWSHAGGRGGSSRGPSMLPGRGFALGMSTPVHRRLKQHLHHYLPEEGEGLPAVAEEPLQQ